MTSLAAGALAFLAFAAPEASSVGVRSTAGLNSGSYQTVATYAGRTYRSVWHLQVEANRITGTSEWDCCPGRRVARLSGRVDAENGEVEITRFCTGQGNPEPCKQVFTGEIEGTRVTGTWSGNGRSGTWSLYLDRVDVKFTVRAGGGEAYLVSDALLLGGGRLVDLNYKSVSDRSTAVLALRLHYEARPDVRVSLRATDTSVGTLQHIRDGNEVDFLHLQVFQSNAPKGRSRYGCPQVGDLAYLRLTERASGDKARLVLYCPGPREIVWNDAGDAAVTLTLVHGHA